MMKQNVIRILLCFNFSFQYSYGFWNNIIKSPFKPPIINKVNPIEKQLLNILESKENQGRGQQTTIEISKQIQLLITALEKQQQESISSTQSYQKPIESNDLDGCWKLLYTSSPGTNSPIQRTFTSSSKVSVYQVINLNNPSSSFLPNNQPDVSNIVCFGDKARLRVTALASTIKRPLVEPRKGDGKILGFNIFGVSSSTPPRDPYERIDFSFQDACFEFVDYPQLSIPYPVPFKLLGDEAKGWIDITYISSTLRISRGNKGTIFVLKKANQNDDDDDDNSSSSDNHSARLASIRNIGDMKTIIKPTRAGQSTALTKPVISSSSSSISSNSNNNNNNKINTIINNKNNNNKNSKQMMTMTKSKSIAIIFPAQLGIQADYNELASSIQSRINLPAFIPSLSRLDWPIGLLPSAFSIAYIQGKLQPQIALKFYLLKIDEAIQQGLKEYPDTQNIVLIAHSIGGWIARAWVSEWCQDEAVKRKVRVLITLGSPHNPPPVDSAMASLDQTRGLLSYINSNYPGAYEKDIEYISVAGTAVTGALPLTTREATNKKMNRNDDDDDDKLSLSSSSSSLNLVDSFQSLLAYVSYFALAGNGQVIGDGIIPVVTSQLAGAQFITLKDVKHSNYLPTPGQSIRLPFLWYGSDDVIDFWLQAIQRALVKTKAKV